MRQVLTLFVSTFSTLLAIINPLEALPVFLKMLALSFIALPLRQCSARFRVRAILRTVKPVLGTNSRV